MDTTPFFIEFQYANDTVLAEIKPCCQENNVFYYDVSINNEYQFTITPGLTDIGNPDWKIALKNADKDFDPELVHIIGEQIDRQYTA